MTSILQSQNFIFRKLVQALIIDDTLIRLDETFFVPQVLKLDIEILCLIKSGREFHKVGAAKEKHLWP